LDKLYKTAKVISPAGSWSDVHNGLWASSDKLFVKRKINDAEKQHCWRAISDEQRAEHEERITKE